MMNAKVLILVTGILFSASVLVSDQKALAEDRAERAEERAEEAAERAEERAEERAKKAEEKAEKRAEKKAEKRAKERAESTEGQSGGSEGEERGSEDVTIKVKGGPQAKFSGMCTVDEEENDIGGQTPQSFEYSLDGQKLECEIRNQSTGPLKITLTSGGDRSVYEVDGRGSTIKLTYTKNGISSSISSGSGGQASSSSSQVSVSSTRAVDS